MTPYPLTFHPWVGDRYIRKYGLLVLGESHYCATEDDARSTLTQEIIADLLDPNSPHESYKNTYIKFSHALAGKALSVEERAKLWHKMAFYNYVQTPISNPRIAPGKAAFRDSEFAFWEVLKDLRPADVIVWGHRLWDALPKGGHRLKPLEIDGERHEQWCYYLPCGHSITFLRMAHPSTGYSPKEWHPVLRWFSGSIAWDISRP